MKRAAPRSVFFAWRGGGGTTTTTRAPSMTTVFRFREEEEQNVLVANHRRRHQQQQQQRSGRLFSNWKSGATATRWWHGTATTRGNGVEETKETATTRPPPRRTNGGGDGDDDATRRRVVHPKSIVDVGQGDMRDQWVPVCGRARALDEEEEEEERDGMMTIVLPGRHFDVPIRVDIAHRVVRWQLARKRGMSTAKTKSRGEVSGTTRKARPQKGGGRARVGSLRAPQMRGGGTAHGPIPRDFEHKLQKKVRRLGLRVALSAKAAEGRLVVVEDLKWMSPTGKTKEAKFGLEKLLRYNSNDDGEEENTSLSPSPLLIGGIGDSGNKINTKFSALIVGDRLETTNASDDGWMLRRGTRNIENIHVMPQEGLNVYSILKHRCLIMTKKAVEDLVERLDKPIKR